MIEAVVFLVAVLVVGAIVWARGAWRRKQAADQQAQRTAIGGSGEPVEPP